MQNEHSGVLPDSSTRILCSRIRRRPSYADFVEVTLELVVRVLNKNFFRSVPPESRSLSLGLQGMAVSLFGTLPSPIIWGLVIDAACLVWDKTCNGARGACSIYHPDRLRIWMHLLYVVIRMVALITDIYVWKHAKHLNIMDEPASEVGS